jgi:hypothetical protein
MQRLIVSALQTLAVSLLFDGPPPVAKTLSPDELRVFFAKGAGLLMTTEQAVLRRIPEASFGMD